MLNIFANSFMTATRTPSCNHWGAHQRYDRRADAEIAVHTIGRRRD